MSRLTNDTEPSTAPRMRFPFRASRTRRVATWIAALLSGPLVFFIVVVVLSRTEVSGLMVPALAGAVCAAATVAWLLKAAGGYGRRAAILAGFLAAASCVVFALVSLLSLSPVQPSRQAPAPVPSPAPPPPVKALVFPPFPWPPPPASARLVLPTRFFSGASTLWDVAGRLTAALDSQRYEYSFLSVPQGFALVSRIERIDDDGASVALPLRWELRLSPTVNTFQSFLQGLFTAPEGHYRVIVVVVTDIPFGQTDARPTSQQTQQWLRIGFNVLPDTVGASPVGPSTQYTALVYEFRGQGFGRFDDFARLVLPGRFEARQHLERAGIWRALEMKGQP